LCLLLHPLDVMLVASLRLEDGQVELVGAELALEDTHHVRYVPGRRHEVGARQPLPDHLVALDGATLGLAAARRLLEDVSDVVAEEELRGSLIDSARVRYQHRADDNVGVAVDPQVRVLVLEVGLAFSEHLRMESSLALGLRLPGCDGLLVGRLCGSMLGSLLGLLPLAKLLDVADVRLLLSLELGLVLLLGLVGKGLLSFHAGRGRDSALLGGCGGLLGQAF